MEIEQIAIVAGLSFAAASIGALSLRPVLAGTLVTVGSFVAWFWYNEAYKTAESIALAGGWGLLVAIYYAPIFYGAAFAGYALRSHFKARRDSGRDTQHG